MSDLQNWINAIVDRKKAEGVEERGQVSIGELAAALRAAPDLPVVVTVNGHTVGVGDVSSYRGYYSDLAIEPGEATAHELARTLSTSIGRTFCGYKGGDFTMSRVTPVWFSSYGDASGLAVTDLNVTDTSVELVLTEEEW